MKLMKYSLMVIGVSTIYCIISIYIMLFVWLSNMQLFSSSRNPVMDVAVLVIAIILLVGITILACRLGKKFLEKWEIKEKIIVILSSLSGIPLSILCLYFILIAFRA